MKRIRYVVLFTFITCSFSIWCQQSYKLSLEESLSLLQKENVNLKIAQQDVEMAKKEHQKTASYWYPLISVNGGYALFSNKIEFEQSLRPLQLDIESYLADKGLNDDKTAAALQRLGDHTLKFELAPQQVASIDAALSWPIFTGLKRLYGTKISRSMIDMAEENKQMVDEGLQMILVDNYFALQLGIHLLKVRDDALKDLEEHYHDALKLEENGMINKADRLFVKVNLDEALREYKNANDAMILARNTLQTLLSLESDNIEVTTPLFICSALPEISYFKEQVRANSNALQQIDIQGKIATNTLRMNATAFAPEISLLGKQTLYAYGVDKHLVPRSMVGVGFTWSLFDGLRRESSIKQARISKHTVELTRDKITNDLDINIDKYYTQIETALNSITALSSTIELSKELLRMRKKSFAEGMATATEVIDARLLLAKVEIAMLTAYYQYDVALMNLCAISGIPDQYYQLASKGKAFAMTENK